MLDHPTYEGRPLANPDEDIYDQGLAFDIGTLMDRRRMLKLMGWSSLFVVAACAAPAASATAGATAAPSGLTSAAASAVTTSAAPATTTTVIPEETGGPFPGDGSNGPDVLTQSGVVRRDIRSSFGSASGVAAGVPLTIQFTVLDATNGFKPLADAAIYVWHCDRDGNYSLYSQSVTTENYLRGVQAAGSNGVVTFSSIFPACYSGRWPHIHFEVYPSLAKATDLANRIATSQIALPETACRAVYATDGYSQSVTNLGQVSLATDMVFGDDLAIHELGTMSGTIATGLNVALTVPVKTA